MNAAAWEHMHDREEAQAVAWMVRVPGRPEARFVSFDRGHAEHYATRMHGTIHPLGELPVKAAAASNGPEAAPGARSVDN